jgi:hypothetical protein
LSLRWLSLVHDNERLSWAVTSLAVFGTFRKRLSWVVTLLAIFGTCHKRLTWVVTSLADFGTCHERLSWVVTSQASVGCRFACCHCERLGAPRQTLILYMCFHLSVLL